MKADEVISEFLRSLDSVVVCSEKLPSGAVWFNVRKDSKFIEIECTKEGQIGISKIQKSDPFMGHDESFLDIEKALEYLGVALGEP